MVVVGQRQRGILRLGEGRVWDKDQVLQDVKTSPSKTCQVPWTNLPQTEVSGWCCSDGQWVPQPLLPRSTVIGLRSAGRQAGRDEAISAITHLLPAPCHQQHQVPSARGE